MDCEEIRDRLADRLTGALDEREAAAMGDHLRGCPSCRAEADALERVWDGLAAIPAAVPDSAAMRARFDAMVDGYEHGREGANVAGRWDRVNGWIAGWWPRQPIAQLAGAAALVAAGVLTGRASVPPPAAPPGGEIAALRGELRDMRQMVTLSLLQQQSASDRLKGVSWSGRLDEPGGEVVSALLDALLHDPNVNVRLASIDALARFGDQQRVRQGAVDALGAATSPIVQAALIDFLVGMQERGSVATLRRLAGDPQVDETVRVRAARGLTAFGVTS
jgi:hypothetical protein